VAVGRNTILILVTLLILVECRDGLVFLNLLLYIEIIIKINKIYKKKQTKCIYLSKTLKNKCERVIYFPFTSVNIHFSQLKIFKLTCKIYLTARIKFVISF